MVKMGRRYACEVGAIERYQVHISRRFEASRRGSYKEGDIPFVPDWKDIKTFGQGKEGDDRLAIYKDTIVENLYGVSPSSALFPITSTKLYATGRLIIQDRASCFPATILIENLRKLGVDISDLKNDIQGAGEKAKGPKRMERIRQLSRTIRTSSLLMPALHRKQDHTLDWFSIDILPQAH